MQLAHAYIERKKWEAEVQAAMVVRALTGDSSAASTGSAAGDVGEYQRVGSGQLLEMMGMRLE